MDLAYQTNKMSFTIKLQTDSILQVPLTSYNNDFTFIVNQKEYKTNKICADLLSPTISKYHMDDPTISEFSINTSSNGDFEHFLQLLSFKQQEVKSSEQSFFSELCKQLGIQNFDVKMGIEDITIDNVFELIEKHEKSEFFYLKYFEKEVEFVSSHFHEVLTKNKEKLQSLSFNTLFRMINSEILHLEDEDELLEFINELCLKNEKFSELYEFVYFENVSNESMEQFISIFNIEYMNTIIWKSICKRLINCETLKITEKTNRKYEQKQKKMICYSPEHGGIFSYFRRESDIDEEVKFTCSSCEGGDKNLLLQIENTENDFFTACKQNEWICFEFQKHLVIPTSYTIRSMKRGANQQHPRSWIIEGSEDNEKWIQLAEETNNSCLNGSNIIHTFPIQTNNETPIKYIRMRLTDYNWYFTDCNYRIEFCSIDFSGQLVE